jgi:hypothetical protein
MTKRFSFWLWGLVVLQMLTSIFHSLSFIAKPQPANDTEKQLLDLITTYKMDAGAGFHPSWYGLFTALSSCFTFICLFAGITNWYFKKQNLEAVKWKGFLLIQSVIFGLVFLVMLFFTFLPPIACTGLIVVFALGSFLSVK